MGPSVVLSLRFLHVDAVSAARCVVASAPPLSSRRSLVCRVRPRRRHCVARARCIPRVIGGLQVCEVRAGCGYRSVRSMCVWGPRGAADQSSCVCMCERACQRACLHQSSTVVSLAVNLAACVAGRGYAAGGSTRMYGGGSRMAELTGACNNATARACVHACMRAVRSSMPATDACSSIRASDAGPLPRRVRQQCQGAA